MTSDAAFVFAVIGIAGLLMASNRVRFDLVAMLVVLALMLSGVLSVGEALAGFGSPVVILVACLLIVGEALARTGAAALVGDWILQHGGSSETRLIALIMLAAGLLGAVMSSTAIVAIFIPIILRIAADTGLNASRMLLPMSYAALISGMLTLIATTPNIVIHEELKAEGYEGFGFFSFSVIGGVMLLVAIIYTLVLGRRLLPAAESIQSTAPTNRSIADLWDTFNETEDFCRMRIPAGASLIGKAVSEVSFSDRFGARLVGIEPGAAETAVLTAPSSGTLLAENDVLVLVAQREQLATLRKTLGLIELASSAPTQKPVAWDVGGASVLIHPDSRLVGKSVRDAEFHTRYRLQVLGMRRDTDIVADYADKPLAAGDSLFVLGPWSRISQLRNNNHDFVVLELPDEQKADSYNRSKMPIALLILVAMVILSIVDVVPLVAAVIAAALAAIVTRCVTVNEAYRSVHWSSIVLIAGMLPLADALTYTGGTQFIVDSLLEFAGESGPYGIMTILFFLTAGLGLVLSNTASAVLVAPIAIYTAYTLGISPYPLAVTVLVAASAAYSTPVSTPVVTLVVDPGRYRFTDFLKVGIPLLLITYLVTLVVTPLVFPF